MRAIGDLEGCWVVLSVMRDLGGLACSMGIPGDKKRITGVLEGAEEAWGVIFEVVGGYWGFCGG